VGMLASIRERTAITTSKEHWNFYSNSDKSITLLSGSN